MNKLELAWQENEPSLNINFFGDELELGSSSKKRKEKKSLKFWNSTQLSSFMTSLSINRLEWSKNQIMNCMKYTKVKTGAHDHGGMEYMV